MAQRFLRQPSSNLSRCIFYLTRVTVATRNSAGTPIYGDYITERQNGAQICYCFITCSFTVSDGQTYWTVADSYGSETFSHWQKDWSTEFETVNVPSTSTRISLTAVYNP
jgi:hypothetical protein